MSQTKAQLVGGVGISTAENITVGSAVTANSSGIVVTGIVTATSFVGDGSNLSNTGSTLSAASGSQRVVVTSQTSGTMTASATDGDLTFDAGSNTLNTSNLSVTGITTLGSSNGIGTVTIGVGATALLVQGSARVTGILTVGEGSVTINGINNSATVPGTITGGTGCITGTMTAATGCVAGTLSAGTGCVTGTMTATTGCVSGTLTAGTATVPGTLTGGTGCVTGTLTAANANIPGTVTGGVVCATSCIAAGSANIPGTVTAGTFSGSGSGLSNIPSGAISGGLSAAEVCTFTSSGTWTKPTSAKFVMVEMLGAGGGGARGSKLVCYYPTQNRVIRGGGGGGGGAYKQAVFPSPSLPPTVTVTIGAGGAGGSGYNPYLQCCLPCTSSDFWNNGCEGCPGGYTTFGTLSVGGGSGACEGNFSPLPFAPCSTSLGGKGGSIYMGVDLGNSKFDSGNGSLWCMGSQSPGCFALQAKDGGGGGAPGGTILSSPYKPSQPGVYPSPTPYNYSCCVYCPQLLCKGLNGLSSLKGGSGGGGGAMNAGWAPGCNLCYLCGGCGAGSCIPCSVANDPTLYLYALCYGAVSGGTPTSRNGASSPSECMFGGGGGTIGCSGGNGGLASGGGGGGGGGLPTGESGCGGAGGNGRVIVYTWS